MNHPYPSPFCPWASIGLPGQSLWRRGVFGFAYAQGDEIWIPLVLAEKKGSGAVGRFLDSLSPRCVIVDVTSKRLEEMLVRRGWVKRLATEHTTWRKR